MIRAATESDLPEITEIYNEAIRTSTATFDTEPKTLEDRLKWLKAHGADRPVLVAEQDGIIVGWGSLSSWSERHAYAGTVENSVYIHERHRRQGIGKQLLEALIAEARTQRLHTILSRITAESQASISLHEALGFARVGTLKEVGKKFGRLLDVHLYQLIL